MGTTEYMECESIKVKQLERVNYFPRQVISADDLRQEQIYQREKRRLHNRLLHGWGIVCGLDVKVKALSNAPLNVVICPGYALSPEGDEIYVPTEIPFDIERCIKGQNAPCSSPCSPVMLSPTVDGEKVLYLAIKYTECKSRPVRVPPVGCGCDDTACEYSRIRDHYEVACLDKLPDSHGKKNQVSDELCSTVTKTKVVACPECPSDPWIVLAKLHVDGGKKIKSGSKTCRRILLSTAVMQEHLRKQCS